MKIIPDERTNSLIVLADPLQMKQIKALIAELDIHSPTASSHVHVYYLKYADALEMVSVLNSLLGGSGSRTRPALPADRARFAGAGQRSGIRRYGTGGAGGFGGGGLGGYGGGGFGSGGYGRWLRGWFRQRLGRRSMAAGGPAARWAAAEVGRRRSPLPAVPGTEFEQPVHVAADPATNSLVVSASPQDYSTLRKNHYRNSTYRAARFTCRR